MTYFSVNDFEQTETIRRSCFLTVLKRTDTEEQALDILSKLKARYRDATHICYAYRVGERAERTRFSDAGEPQGTAGMPILQALIESEATFSLAAVVRWFGGVKLGAGGLTRAYHSCVLNAISAGGRQKFTLCNLFEITCDISLYGALSRVVSARGAYVTERSFTDKVTLTVVAPKASDSLLKALNDALGGLATIKPLPSEYINIE